MRCCRRFGVLARCCTDDDRQHVATSRQCRHRSLLSVLHHTHQFVCRDNKLVVYSKSYVSRSCRSIKQLLLWSAASWRDNASCSPQCPYCSEVKSLFSSLDAPAKVGVVEVEM